MLRMTAAKWQPTRMTARATDKNNCNNPKQQWLHQWLQSTTSTTAASTTLTTTASEGQPTWMTKGQPTRMTAKAMATTNNDWINDCKVQCQQQPQAQHWQQMQAQLKGQPTRMTARATATTNKDCISDRKVQHWQQPQVQPQQQLQVQPTRTTAITIQWSKPVLQVILSLQKWHSHSATPPFLLTYLCTILTGMVMEMEGKIIFWPLCFNSSAEWYFKTLLRLVTIYITSK